MDYEVTRSFRLGGAHINALDNNMFGKGASRTSSVIRCIEAVEDMLDNLPIPLTQQEWDYLYNMYAQHGMAHIAEQYHIAQDIMLFGGVIIPHQLDNVGQDLVGKTYDMPQYLQLIILIKIAKKLSDNPMAKPISTRATGRAIGYQPKPRKGGKPR